SYAFLIPAVLAMIPSRAEGPSTHGIAVAVAAAFLVAALGPALMRLTMMIGTRSVPIVAQTMPDFGVRTTPERLEAARPHLEPPLATRSAFDEWNVPPGFETSMG